MVNQNKQKSAFFVAFTLENEVKLNIFGCHGNELPIKEILYQSVFGDKYYMIGHKFTISVTIDVSPFAWCLARAVLKNYFRMVPFQTEQTPFIDDSA